MTRPKFDETDLALLEVNNEGNELVIDLIREVRIYQDLLAEALELRLWDQTLSDGLDDP